MLSLTHCPGFRGRSQLLGFGGHTSAKREVILPRNRSQLLGFGGHTSAKREVILPRNRSQLLGFGGRLSEASPPSVKNRPGYSARYRLFYKLI